MIRHWVIHPILRYATRWYTQKIIKIYFPVSKTPNMNRNKQSKLITRLFWESTICLVPRDIRDFAFFVFERTKHQPRRNLRSYLVLQWLSTKWHLAPALMHFGTKSWSKMVVSWRYADYLWSQGGPVKLDSMWQHRLTRPLHVQHTYYRIIFKQNLFNIISRGVQRWTSTDFRLK